MDPPDGIRLVELGCGQDEEGVDFYNDRYLEVRGYKFLDLDGDGVWDKDAEPGIAKVTVTLTHVVEEENGAAEATVLNSLVLTTETDEDGYFCFQGLLPGKYLVEVDESTVPPGHYASTPNPVEVELGCGEPAEVLFGNAPYVDISGHKWEDSNCNGKQDAGELGVPGVKVVLLDSEGHEVASFTTGADGAYAFADLKPGVYTVKEALTDVQLAAWFYVSPAEGMHKEVKLLDGKDREGLDFYNCRYGKVTGTKYVDDGDGVLDK